MLIAKQLFNSPVAKGLLVQVEGLIVHLYVTPKLVFARFMVRLSSGCVTFGVAGPVQYITKLGYVYQVRFMYRFCINGTFFHIKLPCCSSE